MEAGRQGVLTVASDGSLTIVGNAIDSMGSSVKNKIVTVPNSDGSVGLYMVPVDGPNKGQMFVVVPASLGSSGKGWAVPPTTSNSVLTPLYSNALASNVNFVQVPVPVQTSSDGSGLAVHNLNSILSPQNNSLAAFPSVVVPSTLSPQMLHNSNQVKIISNGIKPSTGDGNKQTVLSKTIDTHAQKGFQLLAMPSTNTSTLLTPGFTKTSNVTTLSSGNGTLITQASQSSTPISSTNKLVSNSQTTGTAIFSEANPSMKNLIVLPPSNTRENAQLRPVLMFSHSAAASLGKDPQYTTTEGSIQSQPLNTTSSVSQLSSLSTTTTTRCSTDSSLSGTIDHSYSRDSSEKRQIKVCYPSGINTDKSFSNRRNNSVPVYVLSANKNVSSSGVTASDSRPVTISPQASMQNSSPVVQADNSTRLTNSGVSSVQSPVSQIMSTPRTSSDVKVIVCNKSPVAMYSSSAKSLLHSTQAAPRKIQVIRKHLKQNDSTETTSNTLPCKIGQPAVSQSSSAASSTILNLNSIVPDSKVWPKIVIKSEEIPDNTPRKMVFTLKGQKSTNISLKKVPTIQSNDPMGKEMHKKESSENKRLVLDSTEHNESSSPKNDSDTPLVIDSVFSLVSNDCCTESNEKENQKEGGGLEPNSQKNMDFVFREFDFLSNFQGVVLPDDAITDAQIFSPCYVVLETMRMHNMKLKGISNRCTKKCRSRVVQRKSDIRLCIEKHKDKGTKKSKRQRHLDKKNRKKVEQRLGIYSEEMVNDSQKVDSAVSKPVKPAKSPVIVSSALSSTVATPVNPVTSQKVNVSSTLNSTVPTPADPVTSQKVSVSATLNSTVPTPVNLLNSPVIVSSTHDKGGKPEVSVPSTETTNSALDNKTHNPNFQKFFLIKVDNKSVLIPVNAGNSPKAFVLDSNSEKALGISGMVQKKGSGDGGTSFPQSNTHPTKTLLSRPEKPQMLNIKSVAPDSQSSLNVVSKDKVKTEPVTQGYGDELNTNVLCTTKVKPEPMNRGYPDENPSKMQGFGSCLTPNIVEPSPPKLQKMNDPPSSDSTPRVLSKEERISSLKELMRQRERELNELRKKLAQEPQPIVDMDF